MPSNKNLTCFESFAIFIRLLQGEVKVLTGG